MTDGFSQVPLGRAGTGEAVILPQNQQFTNFTRDILRLRQQEQQEAKAQEQDLAGMLGEDLTAKWTEDTIKYFQPKIDEFRKEAVEVFKQNQGRLSPIQMYELKSKFGKLKQEVALNNELYAQEQKRLDELRKDKLSNAPNLDLKESEQLRMIYNNPWQDPEYAAEIKNVYGGNVNAWRAANQGLFENVRSFSPEQYINKNFQDKLSEDYISDEQGRPVAQKTPEGRMFYTKKKFIPQEKIEARVNTAFSGTDYEDTRFKQHYLKEAQQMPINYRTKGVPSLDEEGWKDPELFKFMADEIAKTPELASLNAQQQQQWVARKKATYDVKSKFHESRAVEWYDPKRVSVRGGAGGGGNKKTDPPYFYDNANKNIPKAVNTFNTATTPVAAINDSFMAMGFESPNIQKDSDIAKANIKVPQDVQGKVFEVAPEQLQFIGDKNQPETPDLSVFRRLGITNLPMRVVTMNASYTRNVDGTPRFMTAKEVKARGIDNVGKTVTVRYELDVPALKKMLGRDDLLEKLAMGQQDGTSNEADILISNATKLAESLKNKKVVQYFDLTNKAHVSDLDASFFTKSNPNYKRQQESEVGNTDNEVVIDLSL